MADQSDALMELLDGTIRKLYQDNLKLFLKATTIEDIDLLKMSRGLCDERIKELEQQKQNQISENQIAFNYGKSE